MAAATLGNTRSVASFPKGGSGDAFAVKAAWATITIDSATEDGDIWQLFRLPAGSTVIGGYIIGADGDTGIEQLDIDLGWAATADEIADPDGLGNLGVWIGAKNSAVGNWIPFQGVLMTAGPKTFTAEALIQLETNVAAATGAAMVVTVVCYYLYKAP
jgi:hypothetical protein